MRSDSSGRQTVELTPEQHMTLKWIRSWAGADARVTKISKTGVATVSYQQGTTHIEPNGRTHEF